MPMWTPPTPPQDDNDIYIDHTMCFLYEPSIMPESQLPPVYIKKEYKRIRVDPGIVTRKHKVRKEEQPRVPRSLFDRPIAALRRDAKIKLGLKQGLLKGGYPQPKPMLSRPVMEHSHDHPEWLIHEDWALLQAVQSLLELPLTLSTHTPAHIPNWDLVADIVNATSRTYRSPKQCKNRYENVVVPREEGRILYDINPRKQKKSKGIYKTKNNRPMKTSQLFVQNNNGSVTTLHTLRFDTSKSIASKRTPTLRPTLANPTFKNPKHQAVLAESGINYDQPLTPKEVAEVRKQRIAKEKAAEQQLAAQRAAQQPQAQLTTNTGTGQQVAVPGQQQLVVHGQVPVTATTSTIMQAGTLQQKTTVNNPTAAAAVSLARTLGATGGIVVNAAGGVAGSTFALSKRLGVVGTVTQAATATTSSLAQAVRAARTQPISVQDLAAVVNQGHTRMTAQGSAAQVITTTTLTPAQLVAAQKAGTITASGIVTGTLPQTQTKTLTQTQLQMLRLKQQQQQQQQLRRLGTVQTQKSGASSVTGTLQKGAVSSPLIYSLAQTQVPQTARNQGQKQAGLKQGTVTRSVTPAEIAALLKNQSHLQQSKVQTMSVAITQASPQLQQVQVSQGQVTRLTPAQIIAGTQVQQVQGQSGSVSQPVATLVKTVASQPNVTIPMNALSLGISVTVPQQKTVAGKAMTAQQMRHIQLQQLQRKPATHFQQAQKVATLTSQLAAKGQTPLIIPQQHSQQSMPKVMVHQLQQFVSNKQQAPTIQQIITSIAPQHPTTTTATVIATQLLNQAASTQAHTITKMSVPTSALTTAIAAHQARVTATAATTGVATIPVTVATSAQPSHVTGTPTVTLTPSQATLVKHVQEVVVSPQKTTIPMHTGLAQQLKAIPQTATVRHIHGTTAVTQQPGQSIAHTVTVQQLQQSQAAAAKTQQPSPSVQAAVQQVVQQAQAQAAAAHRHQAAVASAGIGGSPAVAPTTVTVQSSPAVTVTQQAGQQQVVVQSPAGDASQQAKASPHQMRLRNQKT